MTFVLDRSENRCTKYKWLAKSPEAQQIVGRSAELEKMKEKNLNLEKLFKAKGTPKLNTNKQVDQKGNKIFSQNRRMEISMLGIKSLPNKAKGYKNSVR